MTEALKRAKAKYNSEKVTKITVELYGTDADVKNRIEEVATAGESKAAYIKRLIRQDINRTVSKTIEKTQ